MLNDLFLPVNRNQLIKPVGRVIGINEAKSPPGLLYCFPFSDPGFREIKGGLTLSAKGTTQIMGACPHGPGVQHGNLVTTSYLSYGLPAAWTPTAITLELICFVQQGTGYTAFGSDFINTTNSAVAASVTTFPIAIGAGGTATSISLETNTGGQFTTSYNLSPYTYYHLVATWNGTTGTLYVNGVSQATLNATSLTAISAIIFGGCGGDNTAGAVHLLGTVSNTAWNAQEVLARYLDPYSFLQFQQVPWSIVTPPAAGGAITGTLNTTDLTDTSNMSAGVQTPATKTFYLLNTAASSPNWNGALQDGGTAPSAATSAFGWTVAKSSTAYWSGYIGATAAATTASSTTTLTGIRVGTGNGATTAGNTFASTTPYTGNFAAGNWTFNFGMRCSTSSSQAGHINFRVYASTSQTGSGARELTSAAQTGSTISLATTTTTYTSTATWAAPAITLNNEYLFIAVEWQVTTAGGSNSCNVLFYQSAGTIATTGFLANITGAFAATDIVDTSSMPGTVFTPVTGTLSRTDPTDASSIAGQGNVFGPLTSTDPTDTSALTGGIYATGTLTSTDPTDTASLTGTVGFVTTGTLAVIDPTDILAGTAPRLVASTTIAGADSGTSSAIDTTGANLLVFSTNRYSGGTAPVLTDSLGNNYTPIVQLQVPSYTILAVSYCSNPLVGPGHTFTWSSTTGYAGATVEAWATVTPSPLDQYSIAVANQAGAITPSQNGSLLISVIGPSDNSSAGTVDSGFTISSQVPYVNAANEGVASAYLGQATAAAVNPIWTTSPSTPPNGGPVTFVASFKLQTGFTGTVTSALLQGTLVAIDPTDTSAMSGTVFNTATGTLSSTDPTDTSAISGLTAAFGTLAVTDPTDTAAVIGTVVNYGTLAANDNTDTCALTGSVAWTGTFATTDQPDTASFSGSVSWLAALSCIDAADNAALTGSALSVITGSFALTDAVDSASFAVTVFSGVTAVLSAAEAPDVASIGGSVTGVAGTVSVTEGLDSASLSGSAFWLTTLAVIDPVDIAALTGSVAWQGTLATADHPDSANLASTIAWNVTLSAVDQLDVAVLTGAVFFAVTGTLAVTDPHDTISLAGTVFSGVTVVLAATDPIDQSVFAGSLTGVAGTLAAVDFIDTATLSGQVHWEVILNTIDPVDSANITADVITYGTLSALEQPDQSNIISQAYTPGILSVADQLDLADLRGSVHSAAWVDAAPGPVPGVPLDRFESQTSDRVVTVGGADRNVVASPIPPPDRTTGAAASKRVILVSPQKRAA